MSLNIVGGGNARYDPAAVQPMRDDLKRVGSDDTLTPCFYHENGRARVREAVFPDSTLTI